MGFWNRLLGREESIGIKPEVQQFLDKMIMKAQDDIRVEVITKFSGQMNQVFETVNGLKRQVDDLGKKNNKLSEMLRNSEDSIGQLSTKLKALENTVGENAAKSARGIKLISDRIEKIASHTPNDPLKLPEEKMTPFRNAPQ